MSPKQYQSTGSQGARWAPTSGLWPFEPAWLRPSRPLGAQAAWPTQRCGHWLAIHGGRCCASGAHQKVRIFYERKDPQIRYFVAKLSIVAIYALFERPPQSFLRKSSCFGSVFNESQLAFEGLSTKVSLLSESFWRAHFQRGTFEGTSLLCRIEVHI